MPKEGLKSGPTPKGLKSFQVDEDIELHRDDYMFIGDGLYIVKDKHYVYLCEKKAGSTEWPKGFKRIATITPRRLNCMKVLSHKLPGYDGKVWT